MMIQAEQVRARSATDCFLCALDHHACAEAQLSGRIIAARERMINGELLPFITFDTGLTLISLGLTRHYRTLVQQLSAIDLQAHRLTLRVYHLPAQSEQVEYKGRPLLRYIASSYTLAVLEPDILFNITDLSQAEYCSRQYLLQLLVASPPSPASIRGNLVHHAFKELLKAHDRGDETAQADPLAFLRHHFEQALAQNSIDMALANVMPETMRDDVIPHLESLATWFQRQSATLWDMPPAYNNEDDAGEPVQSRNQVRAETFLLAPEMGLRGRLDLFWQQTGRQRFLELKTGGGSNLPKANHRSQVLGYHAQLAVRRDPKMKRALATLLYSGTPGEAEAHGIPFDVRNLQRVNELRNLLVFSHVTGIPAAPPGASRCMKCAVKQHCASVSDLLAWQPPQLDDVNNVQAQFIAPNEERAFFAKFYDLLRLEERASERQIALLWQEDVDARWRRGAAIKDMILQATEVTEQSEWRLTFACDNQSELRESDEVLLSDGDPITGSVVTGTITAIGARSVTVWVPELIANPTLIDKYANDIVHTRTVQNLYRWLRVDAHLRDLVAGRARPRFNDTPVPRRPDFNDEQNLAVARAVQTEDYLLIQGPPGTGKTSVIAEIVKRLCAQGQRVLLAAFTNQAVDNMLTRLDAEGFHDYLRLGHERSVRGDVQGRLLKHVIGSGYDTAHSDLQSAIRDHLHTTPVIASTAATWSSDKYDLLFANPNETQNAGVGADVSRPGADRGNPIGDTRHETRSDGVGADLSRPGAGRGNSTGDTRTAPIDVAIIDEASQLTIPAILGALRFVKRFILVGDEQQLPPLVLSKEAAEQGLADSLFSYLKRLDEREMFAPVGAGVDADVGLGGLPRALVNVDADAGMGDLSRPSATANVVADAGLGGLPRALANVDVDADGKMGGLPRPPATADVSHITESPGGIANVSLATRSCVSLTTQYRMNRWICNFSSRVFYSGKLVADPAIANRVLNMPETGVGFDTEPSGITRALRPSHPLVFVDARDNVGAQFIAPTLKSSVAEALIVRALVQGLLMRGIGERDIGIIAPYRAQVANIRRHLFSDDPASDWRALSTDTPMSIDTVDRFQGGERMVIIMSFATSTAPEPAHQLYDFLTNPNRLNVALTRAQRKLIVVGNMAALCELPYYGRLIAYCESMGTVIGYQP